MCVRRRRNMTAQMHGRLGSGRAPLMDESARLPANRASTKGRADALV